MNILVVEDEKKVASFIKKGLEADSCQVTLSHDGADGFNRANSGEFDLIILDYMLPKKDGLTVLHELREAGNWVPVLMVTAKAETTDVVTGLDAGADDYLAKPFTFAELQARVRALNRRSEQDRGADIRFADLRIDPVNHKVWRNQTEIELSGQEYDLLAYMVRNAGKVLSCANIAANCWEHPIETFSNVIAVYINFLRKKVDAKFPTKLIHTVRRQGYILKEG
jgi:two-component system, OmpR family, copper resistance phosphate regulon response regulator CusR